MDRGRSVLPVSNPSHLVRSNTTLTIPGTAHTCSAFIWDATCSGRSSASSAYAWGIKTVPAVRHLRPEDGARQLALRRADDARPPSVNRNPAQHRPQRLGIGRFGHMTVETGFT